jgi:predicted nucleic acid-binding protein
MNASSLVFVDASAWIALYHKKDKYHQSAWSIYSQLLEEGKTFLFSNWVAYEAISILKSRVNYDAAKSLWDVLQDAELSQIIQIGKRLEEQAVSLFWRYEDKSWGIVDCSSILLMEMKECSQAFGYDHHFVEATKQYGFILL